jgi:GT2 family glycosyltransferase
MISVIVCSRRDPSWDIHERNIRKTIGAPFEYIRIDNRNNSYGICAAYNKGVKHATGEILVFMHEDVFSMEGNWGNVLISKFKDETVGLVGVAGTQYLFAEYPSWVTAGRPFIKGHVIHELNNGKEYYLTVFDWQEKDVDVVAVDGLFFAIRKSLFDTIKFDQQTFDRFHFYDLDICMQIHRTHRLLVTWDLLLKHQSGGSFDESWKMYAARFQEKYRGILPVSTTNVLPDLTRRIPFENCNLKGKASQITIV